MYVVNKILGGLLSPLGMEFVFLLVGLAMYARGGRLRSLAPWMAALSIGWLYFWSTTDFLRYSLEREFPIVTAEESPSADAIVLLGGGIGANTNRYPYAEMSAACDRVWHAARLYKAGKAPVVIPSGTGEDFASIELLRDLGVPRRAILAESEARNTEENARFVEKAVLGARRAAGANGRPRVLVVTSAWHMRRSLLMFRKYAPSLELVPAATDYEATVGKRPFAFTDLIPSPDALASNTYAFREIVGYWGYRLFRR